MTTQEHCKKQFQGVTRLIKGSAVRDVLASYPECLKYVISTEKVGEPDEHVHFIAEGDHRHFSLSRLRALLKARIEAEGKTPKEWINGLLNISPVEKPERMMSYIMKERVDYVHNYSKAYIKQCKKKSFLKKKSMTSAVADLKETLINGSIGLDAYILEYRILRNGYKKPDPQWFKEYDRMEEILKDEETMKKEIQKYKEQKQCVYF